MEKKNEIKETAFSFVYTAFLAAINLVFVAKCEALGGVVINLVLAMVMAFFAAKDYAKLQVLKTDDKK